MPTVGEPLEMTSKEARLTRYSSISVIVMRLWPCTSVTSRRYFRYGVWLTNWNVRNLLADQPVTPDSVSSVVQSDPSFEPAIVKSDGDWLAPLELAL